MNRDVFMPHEHLFRSFCPTLEDDSDCPRKGLMMLPSNLSYNQIKPLPQLLLMINTLNLFARLLRPSKPLTLLSYSALTKQSSFRFSNQEQPKAEEGTQPNQPEQDRAASFYRNTIRRVNTNEKGRGKFTEHHLLRLEQLVEKSEQEPLLYQAYNNYLGHHTVISSTTVDKMLLKSLSFDNFSIGNVLDTLENHNYYGYFPHYAVTKKAIERISAVDDSQYQHLLNAFISSPLIKFNADIVNLLLSQIADPQLNNSNLSRIIKLLAQRDHYHLLQGIITRRELLKKFAEGIEKRLDSQTFKTFRRSDVLKQWLGEVLDSEPHDEQLYYELAVVAVAGKQKHAFGDCLLRIKDTDKVIRCLLYLEECPDSFAQAEVKYLNSLDISEDLRSRLQEFKFSVIDPQTVQSE